MNSLIKIPAVALTILALLLGGCKKPGEPTSKPNEKSTGTAATARVPSATPVAANKPSDWPKDAVWYQIFPERFRNGDPSNDPARDSLELPIAPSAKWRIQSWTADWYARTDWEKELGPEFFDGVLNRRYGGDLQGVIDKLDYLSDLGINAIYFNPIFYARSLHKYDGSSYHHIDPYFGPDPKGDFAIIEKETGDDPATWQWTAADKLFLKLIREAHRRGMHVIIDGVFNHTGRDCFAFRDLEKNQEQSRFRDWYVVQSFDDPDTKRNEFYFKGWWGYKSLPVFAASPDDNDIAPGPKAYIFAATKRWMDPEGNGNTGVGIDGWRLDVAPERPSKFWADWNRNVREINPNAYTSCEIWDNPAKLIADGRFSASMNYFDFAMPVKGFLVDNKIKASDFVKLLNTRRDALPKESAWFMQNLMDSHDTDRLASMIVNSDLPTYTDPEKIDYNANDAARFNPAYKVRKPNERERAIQRMVVLFQAAYVGAPMIYYGDEVGMWGATDPDNRMPMIWADMKFEPQAIDPRGAQRQPDEVAFDAGLFNYYKSAIDLRLKHEALRRGDFLATGTNDGASTLAFERRSGSESLVVVFNRSEQSQTIPVELPAADKAKFAQAKIIFTTGGKTSGATLDTSSGALSIMLPALTGAVIAP